MEKKSFGFIPSIIDTSKHYIMGDQCLNPQVIMPNGHGWADFLPARDVQNVNNLETENCTNYGTLHAIATLGKRKFGAQFQTSLSERYTGVMTGTGPNGNDPQTVVEFIRTSCGVIPEVFLPFDSTILTWSEYYSPKPMNYALYAIGAHWLKKYKLSHQWITLPGDSLATKQQKMKDALQFSPLGVSGFAWSQHADGKYYSDQPYQNHFFDVYEYVDGVSWLIFDSYDNTHKILDWNYNFGQVKGYGLDLNVGAEQLGDTPENVIVLYIGYLLKCFIKSLFI